jgi:hypothetical protein
VIGVAGFPAVCSWILEMTSVKGRQRSLSENPSLENIWKGLDALSGSLLMWRNGSSVSLCPLYGRQTTMTKNVKRLRCNCWRMVGSNLLGVRSIRLTFRIACTVHLTSELSWFVMNGLYNIYNEIPRIDQWRLRTKWRQKRKRCNIVTKNVLEELCDRFENMSCNVEEFWNDEV